VFGMNAAVVVVRRLSGAGKPGEVISFRG
jgi:hypothetical protein